MSTADRVRTAYADDPTYGLLIAAAELGDATYLGERYDADGRKEIAVRFKKGTRIALPNVEGGLGAEEMFASTAGGALQRMEYTGRYFTTVLSEYQNWEQMWFREAVQNAVDARAKNVAIEVRETDEGWLVSCDDDGVGMDEDKLVNGFLSWGGTGKGSGEEGGATGGFGKAKELLLMPWIRWSIHTRDLIAAGVNDRRTAPQVTKARKGTKLAVLMPKDKHTYPWEATDFIRKCYLPNVKFTVNGEDVRANLGKGSELRDFGDGAVTLYHNKKAEQTGYIYVRANGIFMWDIYLGYGTGSQIPGILICELNRKSTELLTVARNAFRDDRVSRELQSFATQLGGDTAELLRKKQKLGKQIYRGAGKFSVSSSDIAAAMSEAQGAFDPKGRKGPGGGVTLTKDQIDALRGVADKASDAETKAEEERGEPLRGGPIVRPNADIVTELLTGMEMAGPTQLEVAVKQLAWKPDFILSNEIPEFSIPRQYRPESMSLAARQLAAFWAEICRYILIKLNCPREFGIGFSFSETHQAYYLREGGEEWIVLNPIIGEGTKSRLKIADDTFSLSDPKQLAFMFSLAVHECTHLVDQIMQHNDAFVAAFGHNVVETREGYERLKGIKRAVVKRIGEERVAERAAASEEKKKHRFIVGLFRKDDGVSFCPWRGGDMRALDAEDAVRIFRSTEDWKNYEYWERYIERYGEGSIGAIPFDDQTDGLFWWRDPYGLVEGSLHSDDELFWLDDKYGNVVYPGANEREADLAYEQDMRMSLSTNAVMRPVQKKNVYQVVWNRGDYNCRSYYIASKSASTAQEWAARQFGSSLATMRKQGGFEVFTRLALKAKP